MPSTLQRCATAALLGIAGVVLSAQTGSPDPAFANIPLDRWIEEGDQTHFRWTARVLPVELSNHQRLQAKIEVLVDGSELVRRRGRGHLVMLAQFSDSQNRAYQTHETLDLTLVKEDTGKSNISYTPTAFVTPGDYRVSLALIDTANGEHSAMRLPLHVAPLKDEPLPGSWRDLPPVEIPRAASSPDDLFLPSIAGRLRLPLETRRRVRVELVVNATPLAAGERPRTEQSSTRSLDSLIPALKAISCTDVLNGVLNVSLLDLTTQRVVFQQNAVRDLDWTKLGPSLKQAGSSVIDLHSLENRRQNVQFFLAQVRRRIIPEERDPGSSGPLPILIVLSGPMAFASGEDLHPIELEGKPEAEVFYIRYHSLPKRATADPFFEGSQFGRRSPLQPGRNPAAINEPADSLERTLKPLRPHLFDVYTPEQFRKALGSLLEEASQN